MDLQEELFDSIEQDKALYAQGKYSSNNTMSWVTTPAVKLGLVNKRQKLSDLVEAIIDYARNNRGIQVSSADTLTAINKVDFIEVDNNTAIINDVYSKIKLTAFELKVLELAKTLNTHTFSHQDIKEHIKPYHSYFYRTPLLKYLDKGIYSISSFCRR